MGLCPDDVVGPDEFLVAPEVGLIIEVGVGPSVIAHHVPFADDPVEDVGIVDDRLADDEEGGRNVFSGKDIEDLGRERGIRAVVKGQDECVVRHLAEVVDGIGAVTDRPGFLFGGVPDEVSGDRVDQLHRRKWWRIR